MRRRDLWAILAVAAALAGTIEYRAAFIEPRAWGALCSASAPPLACVPRGALLWLQQQYLLGDAALALGLLAFLRGGDWAALAAMVAGVIGVENYNATWAMVGGVLGAWCWLERTGPWRGGARAARQEGS